MRKVEQLPFESCLTWCGGGKGREDYSDGDSDRMVVEESESDSAVPLAKASKTVNDVMVLP
jgi:hypothetical protein